jgi:hypothetical protein
MLVLGRPLRCGARLQMLPHEGGVARSISNGSGGYLSFATPVRRRLAADLHHLRLPQPQLRLTSQDSQETGGN